MYIDGNGKSLHEIKNLTLQLVSFANTAFHILRKIMCDTKNDGHEQSKRTDIA